MQGPNEPVKRVKVCRWIFEKRGWNVMVVAETKLMEKGEFKSGKVSAGNFDVETGRARETKWF